MQKVCSTASSHTAQGASVVPVVGPAAVSGWVLEHLNIQAGQRGCPEPAEALGYPCAPMPLCG